MALRDANAATPADAAGVTALNLTTLTVSSGLVNSALIAHVGFDGNPGTVTVTWDSGGTNQGMTPIVSQTATSGCVASLYGLIAPTPGAKTLRVTTTNTVEISINATSYAHVDQTGGVTTFPNSTSATATSTTPAVTLTSAPGNMTVAGANCATVVPGSPTQTLLFQVNGAGASNYGGTEAKGAASVTHQWTITSAAWVTVGTDILSDGSITLVQQTATIAPNFANATSTRAAFTNAITAGNLLTAVITLGSSAATVSTLTDALGNAWQLAVRQAGAAGSSGRAEIWYAQNSAGGTNSVLITMSATNAGTHQCGFHEWLGVSTANALSTTNSTTAASSLHGQGGGVTPDSNGLVIVGWRSLTAYSSAVAITGYSSLSPNLQSRSNAVYRVVGPTSSLENPIWQVGASTIAQGVIVAFRPATASTGGGGGGSVTFAPWGLTLMGMQ